MFAGGDDSDRVAWFDANSGGSTHPVGTKAPNGLGLYDMSGNVRESCEDIFDGYTHSAQDSPLAVGDGVYRVNRGGGWGNRKKHVRVSNRFRLSPESRDSSLGLRLVRME